MGLDWACIKRVTLWQAFVLVVSAFAAGLATAQTSDEPVTSAQGLAIAVVGPLTPSSKAFGIPHLQSITLAVDQYNQQQSEVGRKIHIEILDDKADPETGVSIVRKLAASNVAAILGPANSATTRSVISLLQNENLRIPVISS